MAAKGDTGDWKEHPGKSKIRGCSLRRNAAATPPIVATVPHRNETSDADAAAAAVAANCTAHTTLARQSTRVKVLRAAYEGLAIDDVIDNLNKLTAQDSGSKQVEDAIPSETSDVGSQCSDPFVSEEMGDASSDIIYLEGFSSLDEMEDDDICDENEDSDCEPDYSDEETGEDGGSEQHHGFDKNMGEDDACELPQRMEVDDGSATFMEIDGPTMSAGRTSVQLNELHSFEAFLCPEDREHILKLGLGTHVDYEKFSRVSWHTFPMLCDFDSDFRLSGILPTGGTVYVPTNNPIPKHIPDGNSYVPAAPHVSNENSAAHEEKKSGGSDTSSVFGLLDDAVEVQFERGFVRHWACVDFSSLSYRKSVRLVAAVADMCVAIGMKFYPRPMMMARVKPATFDDIRYTLLNMRKKIFDFFTELKEEESTVFLLVILPDDGQYHERIKELCEILKFTYELCCSYIGDNFFKQELKRTACQIRLKVLTWIVFFFVTELSWFVFIDQVVKCDVRRRQLSLPLVSEAPTIVFGADKLPLGFEEAPGEGSECIATVAASLDWPKFRKYFVTESYQPYGEGIIKDLHNGDGGSMIYFFNLFYKRIKQNPQRIIFFRNGLEWGQFSHICQQEIDAIKQACASFNDRYPPQLTYVVVLPTTFDMAVMMSDKSKDILPGTEADPTKFKFWCCHRGQKNCCYTYVSYHVVHDEDKFPARELQSLTSKLCTFPTGLLCPD